MSHNPTPQTSFSANARETKHEEQREARPEWADVDAIITEATSGHTDQRAHGAARLAALFGSAGDLRTGATPTLTEEQVDGILDACRGALDARREPAEREQLVRVACTALAWDLTPPGFAAEFGEALGVAALLAAQSEATAHLSVSMFHALCFAQALEANAIVMSGSETLLASVVAKDAATKVAATVEADLALMRCAALTATDAADKEHVCAAIRTRLSKHSDNLGETCDVVKAFAIAVEAHSTGDILTVETLESLETVSAKLEGGKDKKKELTHLVRVVIDYIHKGDGPWQTITLQSSQRADNVEAKLETFAELAVVESLRAVTGDLSTVALRQSPLMHALFGIDCDRDMTSDAAKATRVTTKDREERYARLAAAKGRDQARAKGRDRKANADDEAM